MNPIEYSKRIENLRSLASKLAFSPAGAMPPMDPTMMGGQPPMDPAMMAGQAPMDPAMMGGAVPPMDPAMMGGQPPMDPAMMAAQPPMDPAMMGGQPPMDPAMMGGAPSDPTTMELMDMVQGIGYMLVQICKRLDIPLNKEEQEANAENAMLGDDQQALLNAEQAEQDAQDQVLSDQADAAVTENDPGYLQDTLNRFNQA